MLARTLRIVGSAAMLVTAAASVAAAQTYNPSTDWNAGDNPSGPWSYGYSSTLGGFTALPNYGYCYANHNADCWSGPSNSGYTSAFVMHNFTSTTQLLDGGHSLPAGYIELRAVGSPDAIVQWTAPETGVFDITGNFQCDAGDCGGTSYVLFDGTSIFSTTSTGSTPFSFAAFAVSAGQTLDFVLQTDGSTHDMDFAAQIVTEDNGGGGTTTTPEPSSMALLGTGLIGLVPVVRRRSRK